MLILGFFFLYFYFFPMEHMHLPPPRPVSRSTFGEALIVVFVVAGFFVALIQNKISFEDIGTFASFLAAISVFYMALLFFRMLFFWMTGGERISYPWWKHVEMAEKIKPKKE